MRKINIYLHLLMFIGVGVTLLHFFSTQVHAETGVANVYYNEVVDSIELVNDWGRGTGSINVDPSTGKGVYNNIDGYVTYRYYTHYDVTITADNDYAYGSTTVNGQRITFSGRCTNVSVKGRTGTYTIQEGKSVSPPSDSELSLHSYSYSVSYNYDEALVAIQFKPMVGTSSTFDYTSDLENYSFISDYVKTDGYYRVGNYTFGGSSDYQNIYVLQLPVGLATFDKLPEFYWKWSSWLDPVPISIYYVSYTRFGTYIYFVLNNNPRVVPTGSGTLLMKFKDNSAYVYGGQPLSLKYLPYLEDHYFELYKFIEDHGHIAESVNVDDHNESFQDSSQQMIDLEDQLQGDFNSSLGNITIPDNPFGNLGNMFGNSSRFLVHMFNELTLNNGSPFGSVITFSLILGLALLMIGKKGSR